MNESEFELEELYKWLDEIKFSRPKKNVARDFSDGVLVAELLKSFYPRLVEMHNYSPANSYKSKVNNWLTLNKKVLKKLDLVLSKDKISAISSCVPGAVDDFLKSIKTTVESRSERKITGSNAHYSFFTEVSESMSLADQDDYDKEFREKQLRMMAHELNKLKKEVQEKDEVISVMQQKLTHLEAMMELKDQRIMDFTKQINRFKEQSSDSHITKLAKTSNK